MPESVWEFFNRHWPLLPLLFMVLFFAVYSWNPIKSALALLRLATFLFLFLFWGYASISIVTLDSSHDTALSFLLVIAVPLLWSLRRDRRKTLSGLGRSVCDTGSWRISGIFFAVLKGKINSELVRYYLWQAPRGGRNVKGDAGALLASALISWLVPRPRAGGGCLMLESPCPVQFMIENVAGRRSRLERLESLGVQESALFEECPIAGLLDPETHVFRSDQPEGFQLLGENENFRQTLKELEELPDFAWLVAASLRRSRLKLFLEAPYGLLQFAGTEGLVLYREGFKDERWNPDAVRRDFQLLQQGSRAMSGT